MHEGELAPIWLGGLTRADRRAHVGKFFLVTFQRRDDLREDLTAPSVLREPHLQALDLPKVALENETAAGFVREPGRFGRDVRIAVPVTPDPTSEAQKRRNRRRLAVSFSQARFEPFEEHDRFVDERFTKPSEGIANLVVDGGRRQVEFVAFPP